MGPNENRIGLGRVKALPGDGGPCPICGEDMEAKSYPASTISADLNKYIDEQQGGSRGRYWHMRYEHNRFEDYDTMGALLERAEAENERS